MRTGPLVLRPLAILAVLLSLAFVASAHAEQPVTNTNDSGPGSLRNALATAVAGDIVEVPPGTYSLTSGQLVANVNNITLQGQLAGTDKPLIQSTGGFRVLCVNGRVNVTVEDLVIHGGTAAPGAGGACTDSQGGGIHAEPGSTLNVQNSIVQHNTASPAQGGGGGIFAAGSLSVSDSIVRHNTVTAGLTVGNNNGGGGIRWTGSGSFDVTNSTVYENTATVGGNGSGGGGIYSANAPDLTNVTLSGNQHLAAAGVPTGGGGGGLFVQAGVPGSIVHATFFGNHSDRVGGALSGAQTTLENSLFHANTATTSPDCAAGSADSLGGNVSSSAGQCDFASPGDLGGVDPQLGPLAVNGSNNGTLTHAILARPTPAVDFPDPELPRAGRPARRQPLVRHLRQRRLRVRREHERERARLLANRGYPTRARLEPPGRGRGRPLYKVNGGAEIQNDLTATRAGLLRQPRSCSRRAGTRWSTGVTGPMASSRVTASRTCSSTRRRRPST